MYYKHVKQGQEVQGAHTCDSISHCKRNKHPDFPAVIAIIIFFYLTKKERKREGDCIVY